MQKELMNLLKSEINEDIFDIVVYGSTVKGKDQPADVDILVIFRRGTLKERLNKIQVIKKKIKISGKVDIKGILLEELFSPSFFGRSGIFIEGISITEGKHFSEKI